MIPWHPAQAKARRNADDDDWLVVSNIWIICVDQIIILAGEITIYLVGGLEHVLFVHSVGNFIIPTDELIFFRGVGQPPTR